ncbi:hypothetical protein [Aeromicrobium chenweiae]|uniref:Uncharacterized protein n=1 Tax=Aeromicrobium chenweiae TaxID=2079793 RepID=A0A2S0WIH9_9ACTN|nr:hypothetical protein [Aeromicrobium chenweiae]AWB91151.1 hypothetical protein C3E78_02335 [Aeromicrobium chenweiae]TGN31671.1 hypothetical protein E4L97_11850 [Aeromicrobium chenweiae]
MSDDYYIETSEMTDIDEMMALLDWYGLYDLAGECDRIKHLNRLSPAGAKSRYPTALLLFAAIATRVTTSRVKTSKRLKDPLTWQRLGAVWAARPETEGMPFPEAPPTRDQVDQFVEAVTCQRKKNGARIQNVDWHALLQERFQRTSMDQAQVMGNLVPREVVDWTNPSMSNTVIGDGCVVAPFSGVKKMVDPVTRDTVVIGSRAVNKTKNARISTAFSDLTEDDKLDLSGLNMTSMLTPTEHGWVILATGYAPRAELWSALELFGSIAARAGGGVENLLYDGVMTGWPLDHIAGRHGARVFNKSSAHSAKRRKAGAEDKNTSPATSVRHQADDLIDQLKSDNRYRVLSAELNADKNTKLSESAIRTFNNVLNKAAAVDLHRSGAALPLGISVYRSTSAGAVTGSRNQEHHEGYEIVRSHFRYFKSVEHDGTEGVCQHHLFTDDGALHSVESDGTYLVKTATARSISSTRRAHTNGSPEPRFGTDELWEIPCENGDFTIATSWDPDPTLHTPDSTNHSTADPVLNDLRPISRADGQAYADIANYRNHAESWNAWFKSRLRTKGSRAATLSLDSQLFDYLSAACVRNAISWARWYAS